MNRWADLLASFGMAALLHGLLVLGVAWFWTLRPQEFRPVFQSGDVSLAVTFVTTAGDQASPKGYALARDGRQTTDDSLKKVTNAFVEPLAEEEEKQDMLDAETAMPVSAQAFAKAIENGLPTIAPGAKAGRQTPLREAATAGQATDSAAEPPSGALRQGVSGAVRMQSEIRPYYPLGARLRGEEGAVTVRVWVNSSGRALKCEVAHSSGYPALDEAAVDAARRARYVSTRPGAWRAEAETTLTFRFQLKE